MEVKAFKALLASPISNPENLDALPYGEDGLAGSPKFDGVRFHVRGGVLLSRKLKPFPNAQLQFLFGNPAYDGLDGEIVCGDPTAKDCFKRSMQMCMTLEADTRDAILFVFDDFSEPDRPYRERLAIAKGKVGGTRVMRHGVGVSVVEQKTVKTQQDVLILEQTVLNLGFEGLMLRRKDAPYKFGRSTEREAYLLKLKRFEQDEAEILGAFEQMENTNEAKINAVGATQRSSHKAGKVGKDTLGGFHCKMVTGHFKGVEFDVGSGWTDEERRALWYAWQEKKSVKQFNKHHGLLRIKWQKVGADKKPRFPVADGFRDPDDMS